MLRSGRLSTRVACFACSRFPSPDISCSTKWSVPTAPGEIKTWNIACSEWMWIASGSAAAGNAASVTMAMAMKIPALRIARGSHLHAGGHLLHVHMAARTAGAGGGLGPDALHIEDELYLAGFFELQRDR